MTITGALVVAFVIFMLPGFLVSWVAGAKVPAALASTLPVSFGLIGLSAWGWGLTSARFSLLTFTLSLLVALVVAGLWRWVTDPPLRRKGASIRERLLPEGWRKGSIADPAWILPGIGVVTAATMFISDRLNWLDRVPHGVGNIVQGWDVHWHASVVRFIMEEGIASSTRMGELHSPETGTQMFYPAGYHAAVALFGEAAGLDPIPALNIATAIVPAVAFPISVACLVFAVLQSRGLTAQIAAALGAIATYAAPTLMWIPDYVGMWPYLVAVSLTGIVIWQFCSAPARPAMAYPAALGFFGVLVVHPAAGTYIGVPVFLYWLTRLLFVPVRTRLKDLAWLAIPAVAAIILFLPQILMSSTQADEVSSWEPPNEKLDDNAWHAILTMHTRHVDQFFPTFDPTVLLWLAGFGGLVIVVWRRQVWSLLYFGISTMAAVSVLEPFDGWVQDAMDVIASFHYKTSHRLVMPVSMLTLVGAAIAVAVAIRLVTLAPLAVRKNSTAWRVSTGVAALVLTLIAAGGTATWSKAMAAEGAKASYTASRNDDRMVNNDDLLAFDWLGTQPAAYEGLTYGIAADGYAWIYPYNGVPTVDRHYEGTGDGRGSDSSVLENEVAQLGLGRRGAPHDENPADLAAKDLDVKFIISSPGNFWSFQLPPFELLKGLWTTQGVTPVYRKGTTVVFAVSSQFTRSELYQLRQDAISAGSDQIPLPEAF